MAKFCGKCGSKLDDQGKCPNCDPKEPVKIKKKKCTNSDELIRIKQKVIRWSLMGMSTILAIAIIVSILAYCHVINIPVISRLNKKLVLKEDFSTTIGVILGENETDIAYISDMVAFSEDSYRIFADDDLSEKIEKEIEYSIKDIKIDQEKGTANLHFIAPDVYQMICDAIESGKTFASTEDLLAYVKEILDGEYPTIEQTVSASFQLINYHWYWEPSKDVLNILSGNLYQYFENTGSFDFGE